MTRRFSTPLVILSCLVALTSVCYGRVLFRGEQFSYRDAAHFYYPLYERVQAEWDAGRWPPLWEPEENGGMPLLGNPTAAVLYPGKLIYAALPYPAAARTYVVAHTLLAFATTLAMLRGFGLSRTGSALGGLTYAFSGAVLFQYCNIIYLVGAAWLPLGMRGAHLWLRDGRRRGGLELTLALVMETLGGDPQIAYLTGLCAGGYAVALARLRHRAEAGPTPSAGRGVRVVLRAAGAVVLVAAWVSATLAMAYYSTTLRPPQSPPPEPLPWMWAVPPAVLAAWCVAGLVVVSRWRARRGTAAGDSSFLVPMLGGLAGAGALAALITGAQLLPVLEFTGLSGRASTEGLHDVFPFSLPPYRVVEFLWPNVFGTCFHGNREWLSVLDVARKQPKIWVPTLYLGGLGLVLSVAGMRLRGVPSWRGWMTAVAAVSLVGSFGEYTGPIYWARLSPSVAGRIGPLDEPMATPIRLDRQLRDGDGSVYWMMATFLPGFRQFRFPSKLLTLTTLALASLAAAGWDGLASGDARTRRLVRVWGLAMLAATLAVLLATVAGHGAFLAWLKRHVGGNAFGPFDAEGAVRETQAGLTQAAAVFALSVVLAGLTARRARLAAALALGLTTADLALANARYVITAPQSTFEVEPRALSVIKDDARAHPFREGEPYRVHRMPLWSPPGWTDSASDDRVRDFVNWERDTLQPKTGINYGVHYTYTLGVAELYDYEWFFGGFLRSTTPEAARALDVKDGAKVVVFPRRPYDLWNSRYFILPMYANNWTDENRSFATFLARTERVYPPRDAFQGPDRDARQLEFLKTRDFQVRRNLDTFPRAWVVHAARFIKPITRMTRGERKHPMEEITFSNEPFWSDPTRIVYDPKTTVWLEQERQAEVFRFLDGSPPAASEDVAVKRYASDRVELEAVLERPGVVVLSDVYYPGWSLTVDGKPSPIYRANRMMRGAAVPAGRHTLVYEYRPASFRVGLALSCVGLAAFAVLGVAAGRRPTARWAPTDPEPRRT